jgi:hypothetical protein
MIRIRRTILHEYHVECTREHQSAVTETFSAGSNSINGVWCKAGAGEVKGSPELISYVLVVHASDAESVRRVERLVRE